MSKSFINIPGELRVKGVPTIAEDGALLSGNAPGSIVVNGSATLTGNLVVAGDLVVSARLLNPNGYALTVNGDLICGALDFTPASNSVVQGDLEVFGDCKIFNYTQVLIELTGTVSADDMSGDLTTGTDFSSLPNDGSAVFTFTSGPDNGSSSTFTYGSPDNLTANGVFTPNTGVVDHTGNTFKAQQVMVFDSNWQVTPPRQPVFKVHGDLALPAIFNFSGNTGSDASGGILIVGGSLMSTSVGVSLSCNGAGDGATGQAGNGGAIFIGGDAVSGNASTGSSLSANGGSVSTNVAKLCGHGGIVTVCGNTYGEIDVDGGVCTGGLDAGNGGTIFVGGNAAGPNSSFPFPQNGCRLSAQGGSSDSTRRILNGAKAGNITVKGNVSGTVIALGGQTGCSFDYTTDWPSSSGQSPDGGVIQIFGSMSGNAVADGGDAQSTISSIISGGAGGTIHISGDFVGSAECFGGALNDSRDHFPLSSGNGGTCNIDGNCTGQIQANGGSINNNFNTAATTGVGGNINVGGSAVISNSGFIVEGGDVNTPDTGGHVPPPAGAGSAGSVTINGSASAPGSEIRADGGASHGGADVRSGDGGSINISGDAIFPSGNLRTSGGGNDHGEASGNGGTIFVGGDVVCTNLNCQGLTASVAGFNAGNGGNVTIVGSLRADDVRMSGGDSSSLLGGNGGLLAVYGGTIVKNNIALRGGNGGVGQNAGHAGSASLFGGVECTELLMLEGDTGIAPTANVVLALSGYCRVKHLGVVNRSQASITGNGELHGGALLQVGVFDGLAILKNDTGNQQSVAGTESTSLYMYNPAVDPNTGYWVRLQGQKLNLINFTTDATPSGIDTIPTLTDTSMYVRVVITARRTGGSAGATGDAAQYVIEARIKNVADTVTIVDMQKSESEDQPAWDGYIEVSGTNLAISVLGALNNNITWVASYDIQRT